MKVKVSDNLSYLPLSDSVIEWDSTHKCRASELTDEECRLFNVYEYQEKQIPDYDPITHGVREILTGPALIIDGGVQQQWEVYPLPAEDVASNLKTQETNARNAAKSARQSAVEAIKVTTSAGNTFDGDETSQARMARAVESIKYLNAKLAAGTPVELPVEAQEIYRIVDGEYQTIWVLSDNSPAFVGLAEMQEALALAGAAQAAVWVV